MVRVTAHLGWEIEGNREASLASLDEVLEAGVRLVSGSKARVLAHSPGPAAIHRGVDAAGIRVLAWIAELPGVVKALPRVLRFVDGLYLDPGLSSTALIPTLLNIHRSPDLYPLFGSYPLAAPLAR